jgi:hypothetical protein
MSDSLFALVLVFLVLWLAGLCLQVATRRQLRVLYPDIASRIAPGLLHKSIATDLAWLRFIIRREYRSLDRKGFVRLCDLYLLTLATFTIVFAATVAAFVHHSGTRP